MRRTHLTKNNRAFTIVELLMALGITSVLMSGVYFYLIRGIKHNEMETKNLAAIQEMVFIIYNLRMDLRTFVEFENNPDTYASFDKTAKTLKFNIVNGVDDTGRLLYSETKYYMRKDSIMKDFRELSGISLGEQRTRQLSQPGKIKEFDIEMLDADGNAVTNPRKPGRSPLFFRMKVVHSTNARLEVVINICSTYMNKNPDPAEKYWLPCWKIKPITPVMSILSSIDNIKFSTTSVPGFNYTSAGIKVDQTMSMPDGIGGPPQAVISPPAPKPPQPGQAAATANPGTGPGSAAAANQTQSGQTASSSNTGSGYGSGTISTGAPATANTGNSGGQPPKPSQQPPKPEPEKNDDGNSPKPPK